MGQQHSDGQIYPVSYWSRKMTPAERNYHIYDKELLALYSFIEHDAHLLRGIEFTANTDHRALEHLMTQEVLRGRQIRWMMVLQEYRLKIAYHPGALNTVSDWLTRNPMMETTCTRCKKAMQLGTTNSTTGVETNFLTQVQAGYRTDRLLLSIQQTLANQQAASATQRTLASKFVLRQGFWYYYDDRRMRLYIPDLPSLRSSILQRYHDAPASGHQAIFKTLRKIERLYYWPGLRLDVKAFIQTCETCQRQAEPNHSKYGLLHPLPIPEDRGQAISMDWIFLGTSKSGKDSILIIIDRLTKLVVLLPCQKTDTAEDTAKQFVQGWYTRGLGLPMSITSDRDARFTSALWQEIVKLTGLKHSMTTARHQQANGQVEIQGRIAKRILRKYANYHQDNWEDMLPLVEFSMNNSVHSTTGYSPFYLFNGFEPRCFPMEANIPFGTSPGRKLLRLLGRELENAKVAIQEAQEHMCEEYNKHRLPAPEIAPGDSVWLEASGISWPVDMKRPKALLDTWLGPFLVKRGLDDRDNVLVDLTPALSHVHPEFHVSKLRKKPLDDSTRFPARPEQQYPAPIVRSDGQCDKDG
jgi:transposase InsO family protein